MIAVLAIIGGFVVFGLAGVGAMVVYVVVRDGLERSQSVAVSIRENSINDEDLLVFGPPKNPS